MSGWVCRGGGCGGYVGVDRRPGGPWVDAAPTTTRIRVACATARRRSARSSRRSSRRIATTAVRRPPARPPCSSAVCRPSRRRVWGPSRRRRPGAPAPAAGTCCGRSPRRWRSPAARTPGTATPPAAAGTGCAGPARWRPRGSPSRRSDDDATTHRRGHRQRRGRLLVTETVIRGVIMLHPPSTRCCSWSRDELWKCMVYRM